MRRTNADGVGSRSRQHVLIEENTLLGNDSRPLRPNTRETVSLLDRADSLRRRFDFVEYKAIVARIDSPLPRGPVCPGEWNQCGNQHVFESTTVDAVRRKAASRFDLPEETIRVVVAPYRVCPLGAHIDHQLGPVTAMAIDRAVHLAVSSASGPEVHLSSLVFPGDVQFSLADVPDRQAGDWGNYVRGAVRALSERHRLERGIVGLTAGTLAEGGLSSSAAFGVACLLALEEVNGLKVSPGENILLDQKIENDYLGLRNGILDPAAILLSRRGQLAQIDCRTQQHELIAAGGKMPPFTILLAFSGLTKSLVTTDYNRRVGECAAAARTLLDAAGRTQDPPLLGNVRLEEYAEQKIRLNGAAARRRAFLQ